MWRVSPSGRPPPAGSEQKSIHVHAPFCPRASIRLAYTPPRHPLHPTHHSGEVVAVSRSETDAREHWSAREVALPKSRRGP
jgi:hypothetical protein